MARSVPRRFLPALAFAVLLLVVSLFPVPETGGAPPAPLGIALDKWVHAGSYAALAVLLAWARESQKLAAVALAVAVAVGYGAGIELLQGLVPSRGTSGADAVANTVGAALAGLAWLVFARWTGYAVESVTHD